MPSPRTSRLTRPSHDNGDVATAVLPQRLNAPVGGTLGGGGGLGFAGWGPTGETRAHQDGNLGPGRRYVHRRFGL